MLPVNRGQPWARPLADALTDDFRSAPAPLQVHVSRRSVRLTCSLHTACRGSGNRRGHEFVIGQDVADLIVRQTDEHPAWTGQRRFEFEP